MPDSPLSYRQVGVDIDAADATKRAMAKSIDTGDARVLNRLGAFASLIDARFSGYHHPILVLKTEEPGSKQKLAFQHGRVRSIALDLVHHLIDDIVVMGARPYAVQDCIVCGRLEPEIVKALVDAIAGACRDQGCVLVGGETSEQPGVVEPGVYILTASIVGVVEKERILDGSRIRKGDVVLAAASNGLHTNGYSLVRALMARDPELAGRDVEGRSFLDAILEPHRCYFRPLEGLFEHDGLHGLAHITGGGIAGNLNRILPETLDARIDAGRIRVLPVFAAIRDAGSVEDTEMLRTFNLGVGLTVVAAPDAVEEIAAHLEACGVSAYPVGEIMPGTGQVVINGTLDWRS